MNLKRFLYYPHQTLFVPGSIAISCWLAVTRYKPCHLTCKIFSQNMKLDFSIPRPNILQNIDPSLWIFGFNSILEYVSKKLRWNYIIPCAMCKWANKISVCVRIFDISWKQPISIFNLFEGSESGRIRQKQSLQMMLSRNVK